MSLCPEHLHPVPAGQGLGNLLTLQDLNRANGRADAHHRGPPPDCFPVAADRAAISTSITVRKTEGIGEEEPLRCSFPAVLGGLWGDAVCYRCSRAQCTVQAGWGAGR